jgi:integrase/recombinase XerD
MEAPVITIFVRHSAACKYAGDEFCKRCQCKKHLRWTHNGKQYRRKTGARSWAGAEDVKRDLEAQLTGRTPEPSEGVLVSQAIETFQAAKINQGVTKQIVTAYRSLLARFLDFSEKKGLLTVQRALTLENLTAFMASRAGDASSTRSLLQMRMKHFTRFAYDAGWISRVPRLAAVKVDEPETEPLSDGEYSAIEAAATGKTQTIIKLMRWSGLAVRDASTLARADLNRDAATGLYRVIRNRTKTGAPLYIPIPTLLGDELLKVANGNPVFVFWDKQKASSDGAGQASNVGRDISAAFKAAGVESEGHMISHRLRATFAVDLLTKGVPLEHVSKLLGHKSVTTTERHYAKWVKGRQDRLDALVSATWGP